MKYTVGSVPYLNAKPLVRMFEDLGEDSPVKVVYDVPSKLPALLAEGAVQAIMVSSIEALRSPGKRIAEGVCIGSQREVLSVRLFSKVPVTRIRSLALDQSSMTSNALARILLKERYDVVPETEPRPPNLAEMLDKHDACVLIGDNGMREDGKGLHILDLGLEWYRLKKLPFVWAVWMGDEGLTPELSKWLVTAELAGHARLDSVIADAPHETGLPQELCERYLRKIMHYPMQEKELEGLKEFGLLLGEYGLLDQVHFPAIIAPDFSEEFELARTVALDAPWIVIRSERRL